MVNGSRTFSCSATARSSSIGPSTFTRGALGSSAPGSTRSTRSNCSCAMRRIQAWSSGNRLSSSSV